MPPEPVVAAGRPSHRPSCRPALPLDDRALADRRPLGRPPGLRGVAGRSALLGLGVLGAPRRPCWPRCRRGLFDSPLGLAELAVGGHAGELEDLLDDVGLAGPGGHLAPEGAGDLLQFVAVLAFERLALGASTLMRLLFSRRSRTGGSPLGARFAGPARPPSGGRPLRLSAAATCGGADADLRRR